MSNPFFSIIVVSLNAQETIKETINSVLKQSFDDYEIVVKDGLSKDNTINEIPKSDKIRIYEQPDKSIYDAMNQGIELSKGKYLCFLNCGDFFENKDVLKKIYEKAITLENDENIIYGNYMRKGVLGKQPGKISDFYLFRTPLCHQTMFFSKKLFEINGLYDTNYKIYADYNHTLKDFKSGKKLVYCDVVVCDYLGGGVSESEKGRIIKKQEYQKVVKTYYTKKEIRKYNIKLALSMRKFRQKLASDDAPDWVRKLYRSLVNKVNG